MPNPFLAPDTLAQGRAVDRRADHDHQPARVARRACCARRCARACCRRSRSTSRTAAPASRCSRSATSTRPARASCPTSTRRWRSCSPARRRRRRSPCGARSSSALGVGARDRPGPCRRPACTRRARRRCRPGKDPIGGVGEVASGRARAVRRLRAGRDPRARPRRCSAGSRSRRSGRPTSRYPSSDLDLAFVLADDVPAERLDKAIRQGAGEPARRPRRCSTSTAASASADGTSQPRLPPAAAGAGPQPHRRRHRRGPPRRRRQRPRSSAPICEADDDAWRTRSRRGCWPRSTCSSARACSRSSTGDWPGLRQKAPTPSILEDEGQTLVRRSIPDAVEVGAAGRVRRRVAHARRCMRARSRASASPLRWRPPRRLGCARAT